MKFSKLVETVSKKPIPPHVKHLIAEIMVSDEEGEDVEVSGLFCCALPLVLMLCAHVALGSVLGDRHLSIGIQ
jgi:hypothetical protein